jgi:hypothetical protein
MYMVLCSYTKQLFSPQILSCVMLTVTKTHLYPTWKLHSHTSKDEIKSPLQWYNLKLILGIAKILWVTSPLQSHVEL